MAHRKLVWMLLFVFLAGCTHRQLTKSTVATASTVTEIQYQIILSNIAMFTCMPETLPWHLRLEDGTIQISDEGGLSGDGGLTMFNGTRLGIDQFGPRALREVSEQWGGSPVTSPIELKDLQDVYRQALGLEPLPDPRVIRQARREQERQAEQERKDNENGGNGNGGNGLRRPRNGNRVQNAGAFQTPTEQAPMPIGPLFTDPPGVREGPEIVENDDEEDEIDVPMGWFQIGSKKDVPQNACYVGCYGDVYAWAMPEDMASLSHFALIVLTITELSPEEIGPARGLIGRRARR
jgi:hypothetical protein